MRIVTLFFGSVLALLLGGCMLPRPWLAPLPTEVCPVEELSGSEQLLVVSFRVPDCRKPGLKWTAFRSNHTQYAAADATRRTRLVDELKWKALLDRRVEQTKLAPIIYIHGYFNGQDDAVDRALAIRALLCPRTTAPSEVHRCAAKRPVVALTWPSHNRFAKYAWDEANSEWSIEQSVKKILEIADKHRGTTLVAHSMGNRILVAVALAADALAADGRPALFDRLVLASPDVDRGQVVRLLERGEGLGFPATIYASRKDQALSASWRTHGYPRAGDLSYWVSGRTPGYPYSDFKNAEIVDTSETRAGLTAHAAFAESPEGAADLCHVLGGDALKPGRDRDSHYSAYWVLRRDGKSDDDCAALARAAVPIAKGKPPPAR